jgi:hypothetical protein
MKYNTIEKVINRREKRMLDMEKHTILAEANPNYNIIYATVVFPPSPQEKCRVLVDANPFITYNEPTTIVSRGAFAMQHIRYYFRD